MDAKNKYTDSYAERNSGPDMADELMLKHLDSNGFKENIDYLRTGTDPKTNKLDLFWFATKILLLPDYILVTKGFIFFIEVKGTKRLKESDYFKIQEMAYKGQRYKQVKVGIMYFTNPKSEPVWLDHKKLKDMWFDDTIPIQYYPEKDFEGNLKAYKILPI